MIITKAMLSGAAAEIREAEAALGRIIAELDNNGVWSGADSQRFQHDWNSLVRNRLLGAANALDAASVVTLM